jgi:uncharacterized MnhB-related membrane protein
VTTVVQSVAMVMVAVTGLSVVLTRNPLNQVIVFALFGSSLAVLFLTLQAPDVALSEMVVGAVAYPAMILLTLAKVRNRERDQG